MYSTCCLLYNIRTRYDFGLLQLIYISPRFAIVIISMVLSIIFTVIDLLAVTDTLKSILPIGGINPFWKLAFVFKLLTDSIILDDFKTALDRLSQYNLSRIEHRVENWVNAKDIAISRVRTRDPSVPCSSNTVAAGSS